MTKNSPVLLPGRTSRILRPYKVSCTSSSSRESRPDSDVVLLRLSGPFAALMSRNACNGENGETGKKYIASRWRFELDAKSGPLEAGDFGENGDFGEIGDFGKNCHACSGENGEKSPASGDLNWMPKVAPWRLAILAKMAILAKIARGLAICGKIFKLDDWWLLQSR